MTSRQEAKLNMYDAVLLHCEVNLVLINTIHAFADAAGVFRNKVIELKSAAQSEKIIITGVALDKGQIKKTLSQMAAAVSSSVYAYAVVANDTVLREKMSHSYSGLFRLRDEDLVQTCRNIHAEANAVVSSLSTYGISSTTLNLLQTTIDNYAFKVPAPRNAASLRATYRATIAALIKEIDDVLKNRMDKIVIQFQQPEPIFYKAYKNNRIILDPTTTATKIAGAITETGTDRLLEAVQITVVGQSFNAITDVFGNYELRTPVPGTYTVKFEKPGYITKEIEGVVVSLGQVTTLNIELDLQP